MVTQAVIHLFASPDGLAHPEVERRTAAMLPPAGAGLLEFAQAVRRLQDGDTQAPITVPARPEPGSLLPFDRVSHLYFDLIEGDVPATRQPRRQPGRRMP